MDPLMSGEVGTLVKGLLTFVAFVRLLVGVGSLMLEKCGEVEECLPTVLALVGLLICVDPLVLDQQGAVGEGFPALLTLARFLPRVKAVMLNKVCMLLKDLTTDLTLIGLLIDLIWGELEVIGKSSAAPLQFITSVPSKIPLTLHLICVIDKGILVHFIKFVTGRNSYLLSDGFTCFLFRVFPFRMSHFTQGNGCRLNEFG